MAIEKDKWSQDGNDAGDNDSSWMLSVLVTKPEKRWGARSGTDALRSVCTRTVRIYDLLDLLDACGRSFDALCCLS